MNCLYSLQCKWTLLYVNVDEHHSAYIISEKVWSRKTLTWKRKKIHSNLLETIYSSKDKEPSGHISEV